MISNQVAMETTFILKEDELNEDFLSALKKLFRFKSQIQVTVSVSEDFGLLKKESLEECLKRIEKTMVEIEQPTHRIEISPDQLDEMVLEKF